jgi:ubiquinone/menaquinone biosynthesis C-methylase UbiE
MNQPSGARPKSGCGHYDSNYGNFHTALYEEIRREAFGEDIGQNSWHTAEEQNKFIDGLGLSAGKTLLDVACGAGGPALRIAVITNCSVVGVDFHEQAVSAARTLTAERRLEHLAKFQRADASATLPFPDHSFNALVCIDAINHLPDRPRVLADWARLLKPGGRLLFTDATIITGPLTNAEIAARSSAGFYLFVPGKYDEQVIAQSGLRLHTAENVTQNTADVAERRLTARASRREALIQVEGQQGYEAQQEFLSVAARVAREGRLSRFVFVADKSS